MDSPSTVGMNSAGEYNDFVRQQEETEKQKVMNHPVNINGHSLKIGDVFPDHYDAKKFHGAVKLLDKGAGSTDSGDDHEPDGEPDEEGENAVASQLFGKGGKAKVKEPVSLKPKTPMATNEPDGE